MSHSLLPARALLIAGISACAVAAAVTPASAVGLEPQSPRMVVPTLDVAPPLPPERVDGQPGDVGSSSIVVRWAAPADATMRVKEYRVAVEDQVYTVPSGTLSKRLDGLGADSDYYVLVTAVDNQGNESEALVLQYTTAQPTPPPVPWKVTGVAAAEVRADSLELRWTASTDSDGSIRVYLVYQDGVLVKTVTSTSTSTTITGLTPRTAYRFSVAAVDDEGRQGPASDPVTVTTKPEVIVDPPAWHFAVAGTAQVRTLVKGQLPLSGEQKGVITLSTGRVEADLSLRPTQGRLVALGFLPVTAKVAFVMNGKTTGLLAGGALTTKSSVRIKLPEVKLFGAIPLAGGNNCQTKSLSTIDLTSTDLFDPAVGGSLAGTFAISDLNGCGVLNGLVSPLTAGGGNTLTLNLTSKA